MKNEEKLSLIEPDKNTLAVLRSIIKKETADRYRRDPNHPYAHYACVRKAKLLATDGRCGAMFFGYGNYQEGCYKLEGNCLVKTENQFFPKLEDVINLIEESVLLAHRCDTLHEIVTAATIGNIALDYWNFERFLKAVLHFSPNFLSRGADTIAYFADSFMWACLMPIRIWKNN